MRDLSVDNIASHRKEEILRWRLDSKAGMDRWEKRERPADRTGFYLRRVENMASHVAGVAMGIGTIVPSLLTSVDVAAERAEEGNRLSNQSEQWLGLWESLKHAIGALHGWVGDAVVTAHFAKVVFVSAVVLRRWYELGSADGPSGDEVAFECLAKEVPFPIDTRQPMTVQVESVSRNLDWFHEQIRTGTGRPRWW
jgi:hypothetical protein